MTTTRVALIVAACALAQAAARGEPLSTKFSYQGQLAINNVPLNGSADFIFTLHDAVQGGDQVGDTQSIPDHPVVDGVFSVDLDFGVDVFNGDERWLQMSVRAPHDPTDMAPHTTLAPRQRIAATPYALQTRGLFVDEAGNTKVGPESPGPGPLPLFAAVTAEAGKPGVLGESRATSGAAEGVKGKSASTAGKGVVGEATATTGLARGVEGKSASAMGEGVFGEATATTGPTKGVFGRVESTDGEGLVGEATATTGPAKGVRGTSASSAGEGVRGEAISLTGAAMGVCGVAASDAGTGVVGEATAGSGATRGVHGKSASSAGEGVRGEATATTGAAMGVCGVAASDAGTGIVGMATAGTGATKGVHGSSASTSGEGVRGEATATTGAAMGVCGVSASSSGTGIVGAATATTGSTRGVHGTSASGLGVGVLGESSSNSGGIGVQGFGHPSLGVGVEGQGSTGVRGIEAGTGIGAGVLGIGQKGVVGQSVGIAGVVGEFNGITTAGYGVHGKSDSEEPEGAGVLAEGNGVGPGPPELRAAALEIRNGAIRVSGQNRPAGTITLLDAPALSLDSMTTVCPMCTHSHIVGKYVDFELHNDLLADDSIMLLTIQAGNSGQQNAYNAHVLSQGAITGQRTIRVSRIGSGTDPSQIRIHYLIINPAGPE